MAKKAGSGSKDAGAINIISRIFANTCVNENTEAIWPEDGAMIMPLLVFVKKDKIEELKPLLDFIYGRTFAKNALRPSILPFIQGLITSFPKEPV